MRVNLNVDLAILTLKEYGAVITLSDFFARFRPTRVFKDLTIRLGKVKVDVEVNGFHNNFDHLIKANSRFSEMEKSMECRRYQCDITKESLTYAKGKGFELLIYDKERDSKVLVEADSFYIDI